MRSITEIKNRIRSVSDTSNITKAMQLISVAKLTRAEDRYSKNQSFCDGVRSTLSFALSHIKKEVKSVYLRQGEVKRVAFLVVSANTGMAGDYNHRVLRYALKRYGEEKEPLLYIIGQIGRDYFESFGINPAKDMSFAADDPMQSDAMAIAEELMELYTSGLADEVRIIYTAPNGAQGKVVEDRLLPILKSDFCPDESGDERAIPFEPGPEEVFDVVVPLYVSGEIYSALIHSIKCEHTERIAAMSNATNKASDMLEDLKLQYNRARQDKITTELSEISSGMVGKY